MYAPDNVPENLNELSAYLRREMAKISNTLMNLEVESVKLKTHNAAPGKPREGHIYRADGTNWNPGSGEGVYEYTSGGTWNKL